MFEDVSLTNANNYTNPTSTSGLPWSVLRLVCAQCPDWRIHGLITCTSDNLCRVMFITSVRSRTDDHRLHVIIIIIIMYLVQTSCVYDVRRVSRGTCTIATRAGFPSRFSERRSVYHRPRRYKGRSLTRSSNQSLAVMIQTNIPVATTRSG